MWDFFNRFLDNKSLNPRHRNRDPKPVYTWSAPGNRRRLERREGARSPVWPYATTGLGLGVLLGIGVFLWPVADATEAAGASQSVQRSFTLCHTGGGTNCVIDGDTIWLDGSKIRVADIDAPETHDPQCSAELESGNRATQRLHDLINTGPFEVKQIGDRDRDKYGRQLRVLVRNGQSLGDILVSEGLARTWDGARHPWC